MEVFKMKDIRAYNTIVNKLRAFFLEKGFIEVPAQSRLSILAACEDPKTICKFKFNGEEFPLPQTGQMWLEHELLKDLSIRGVFCITTSYRDEPNPIEGRHDKVFPMFEFEGRGDIQNLTSMEKDVLKYLGFSGEASVEYNELSEKYGVRELTAEHEEKMWKDIGNVVFLTRFPQHTHPFWNMKHHQNGIFNKIDVILYGMETIGSAERSCNAKEMRENFETISNGEYARLLFEKFGKERVMSELQNYLSFEMTPRFGGGIGITRMARAMKLAGIL
ncbi:transposase [Candidatus Woesearchaeota archaeon]|nr:transposase [Candidatus Woesearchaeota archaeon]